MTELKTQIERRRTFAIISHPDAGKTTLTEKFLLYGGAIQSAGSVKGKQSDKHAVSDWMEIEKQRGISITSSVLQFEYDGYCINLLDTPGHQDFSEDTYRTLMAADSAVMVIDAAKGIEPQTRKLFKVCAMRGIPIFTFINKLDREARDPFDLLDELEREFGIGTYPMNWPIGCGQKFKGVYDRIKRQILSFDDAHRGRELIHGIECDITDTEKLDELIGERMREKFKHFLPMDPIDILVTRVDKDKVVVDPISPMLDSWLSPILKDPTIQKVIPTADGNGPKPIMVKDLKLTRGGFMGKAVIPNVSEFVGEDYTVDAFVPGSQIVLNITDNFEQFNGKSIWAFVVNYMPKPGSKTDMSLVCSAKEYIKFVGEVNLIQLFNSWCEGSDLWKNSTATPIEGKVTGVINSSKKCGVFVELPSLSITGMVQAKPEELVNYKPHQEVMVKIAGFDEDTFYNPVVKQVQHADPYVIEDGRLKKCNLKPILKFA